MQAESEFVRHHVCNIVATADKETWQASTGLLEREFPTGFALRAELRVNKGQEHDSEEDEYKEIMAGNPKLRKMGHDFFRAIDEERRKRAGSNGSS